MESALFSPVTDLKGVGTKTAANLASLGIYSIYDLLYYYPFRYDELTTLPLDQIMDGQKVVLKGIVATEPYVTRFGYKKSRLSFKLRIDHDVIMVNFFNQPWLRSQFETGKEVAVYGKYETTRQSLTGFKLIAGKKDDNGMAPIYPSNRHLHQKKIQALVDQALNEYADQLPDTVPEDIRQKFRLLTDKDIVKQMHHPLNPQAAQTARRSAIFREFFIFQMQLARLTGSKQGVKGISKQYDLAEIAKLTASLPFTLSADQKKVINEIFADLHRDQQMRRLLQGDVGSGKTIVAVYAIFAAITAGYQAALMVPTEILASQHFQKIAALLQPLGVRVALLTGSTKTLEKRELYRELQNGMINVVVGTHALIQQDVVFKKLGLVIIDEQHRFGVAQRQKLINKGQQPDILAMTATPIPRTLALTVYGEMAVSEIKTMPKGRKPIRSLWCTSSQMDQVYAEMNRQLQAGFQIYAVTPLISESEALDLKSAEVLYEKLHHDFPKYRVVLLHGQLPGKEKDEIMTEFADGQIDILVTTSVIEVGVDVPNANMMVVYDADRFGLSQLHQLRGRIGRGQTASTCIFIADPKTDSGKERMRIIAETQDGFALAEEDLKLRGEGDLFGKAQSGVPEFKVGDVVNNYNTMVAAQKEARRVNQEDPDLSELDHAWLNNVLEYKQIEQTRD
ncbi:ATP-dependent DNA helicase RecG [Lactobacillus corticis]|uniref:ATP-dependent DNA helicase RecG n=2 Tax=Lactobacillus corticis TaxID=2201249 RepID=A0A916VI06_9LACO|nr:ATP-dependent DNA helicase RecG [Lactobacillus corticis]